MLPVSAGSHGFVHLLSSSEFSLSVCLLFEVEEKRKAKVSAVRRTDLLNSTEKEGVERYGAGDLNSSGHLQSA